jgi:uncharacterized protein
VQPREETKTPTFDNRPQSPSEVLSANKRIVADFFDYWAHGNSDRIERLLDPEGEWWTLAKRKTRTMRAQLDRITALQAEARHGIGFRINVMTAEEDRVAAVVESHAEFAEQGTYNNLYHFLFRIVDGRISRIWVYYDTALANRVLRGEGGTTPVGSHAAERLVLCG